MEEKIKSGITVSVERILRYLIPGVAFFILFSLSDSTDYNKVLSRISENGLMAFLLILTVGMSIYVVYSLIIRFTLERIVFKCGKSPVNLFCSGRCLCEYSKAHAELLLTRNNNKDYPSGYYTYLWSITHYAIILSIMILIFAIVNTDESWFGKNYIGISIVIFGISILILSICSYFYMQKLEKDTTAILISNKKGSKESENTTT